MDSGLHEPRQKQTGWALQLRGCPFCLVLVWFTSRIAGCLIHAGSFKRNTTFNAYPSCGFDTVVTIPLYNSALLLIFMIPIPIPSFEISQPFPLSEMSKIISFPCLVKFIVA